MATFVYDNVKAAILKGDLQLDGGHDIRVALLSGGTTADTEKDKVTIDGFTTLDELSATSYARVALANEAVSTDGGSNRGEFDADNVAFGAIGGASNDEIVGFLIFRFITNDSDSIPIAFIDNPSELPFTTNGGTVTIQWDAQGIIQAT